MMDSYDSYAITGFKQMICTGNTLLLLLYSIR